eukprot:COSAG01_NODE_28693_length_655_cov_0.911871_1_plen_47_part_10
MSCLVLRTRPWNTLHAQRDQPRRLGDGRLPRRPQPRFALLGRLSFRR